MRRALTVLREVGAIDNATYRNINQLDTLTSSRHLQRLRDLDLLEQRGKSSGTYYVPGKLLVDSLGQGLPAELNPTGKGHRSTDKVASSTGKTPQLPDKLATAVQQLGRRSQPASVRTVILQLCTWQPLTAAQLAAILGRRHAHLVESYLRPMLREGLLQHTHRESPNHPLQAYRSRQEEGSDLRG